MNLDEAQKKTITQWIAEGLKLADIQKRMGSELGLNPTYMEVRLLVDDLKLTPKDVEPPKPLELTSPDGRRQNAGAPSPTPAPPPAGAKPAAPGKVSVALDELSRPGAVASGKVTFSDGKTAEWYLDEMGRLGLMPAQQGYRPSQQDVAAFQTELQAVLGRLGM